MTAGGPERPIIPDYAGANVRGILPALLGPATWATGLPDWMPAPVRDADAAVVLVVDGLGWDQFQEHRDLMPTLAGMDGRAIHTVAPTTTATALSSIATGLTPGEHGIIGYRIVLGGEVVNMLRWSADDHSVRRSHPPVDVQPFTPFLGRAVPVVSPTELQSSAFSEAHLRGAKPVGWRAPSSIGVEARAQLDAGEKVVYCYYGGIDKIAHERGFGPYYEAELRFADALVADVLASLPTGAVLVVTADHGQVHVGPHRGAVGEPARAGHAAVRGGALPLVARAGHPAGPGGRRGERGGRPLGLGGHPGPDARRAVVRADRGATGAIAPR